MSFCLTGLDPTRFESLWGLDDAALAERAITRLKAEEGYPDRITLSDIKIGAPTLLLNFEHLPAPSAYRANGPIFVAEGQEEVGRYENRIPVDMVGRLYSVRAYDHRNWMIDADVAEGLDLPPLFDRIFSDGAAFIHLHHARRGCFACRVDPVDYYKETGR